jgi:hypothetical protein
MLRQEVYALDGTLKSFILCGNRTNFTIQRLQPGWECRTQSHPVNPSAITNATLMTRASACTDFVINMAMCLIRFAIGYAD